ncbi:MAG TPA: type II secretion system protein [Patescibacteria group bacterium]|nr:type II secretion system protein [Patescibacteria group bacterium]
MVKNKKMKAFTLIELLVVISIIALLSSIAVASLNTTRAKARDAKRVADLKNIFTALELYYDKYGQYLSGVFSTNGYSGDLITSGLTEFMTVPKDPLNRAVVVSGDGYGYYYASGYYPTSATVAVAGGGTERYIMATRLEKSGLTPITVQGTVGGWNNNTNNYLIGK